MHVCVYCTYAGCYTFTSACLHVCCVYALVALFVYIQCEPLVYFLLQSTPSLSLVVPDEGRVLSATFSSEKSVLSEKIQQKVKLQVGVV